MNLKQNDLDLLDSKGISKEKLEEELRMLSEGFPFLKIEAAATVADGIKVPTAELQKTSVDIWNEYLAKGGKVVKMVPASGAASRMFKDVFAFANSKNEKPDSDFIKTFFDNLEQYAFFPILNTKLVELYSKSADTLVKEGRYKDIVNTLLHINGLNYGKLPKALLRFHKYLGWSRTPLEEHLAEGAQYAAGKDGVARIHFTVSDEHLPLVRTKLEEVKGWLGKQYGVDYDLSLSIQKPSTDTVAANMDGTPYREEGNLFFRPGGHGALIENLNDIDADVVFIKNIDNVVPDTLREATLQFKRVCGGILVGAKQKADEYCKILEKGTPAGEVLDEMLAFLRQVLCVTHDRADEMNDDEKAAYIFSKLNRPMRVCGMVKNEGEPGGGPFLVYSPDGTVQPQILESVQINTADKRAVEMLENATHFNPVDLVCALRDYKGEKFDLPKYVDPSTGFISIKSREGVEIKALELPGLWNGAMADWNTILVEVPVETFNPVKTVNDLLRKSHQPD